ncbi:hypothetical protein ACO1MB_14045, partial [Staphylococcus aureus]
MSTPATKGAAGPIFSAILIAAFLAGSLLAVLETENQRVLGICVLAIATLAFAAAKLGIVQGAERAGA